MFFEFISINVYFDSDLHVEQLFMQLNDLNIAVIDTGSSSCVLTPILSNISLGNDRNWCYELIISGKGLSFSGSSLVGGVIRIEVN